MTERPAAIDRRYHDAVIFNLDGLVADTASGGVRAFDSAVPLLRRFRGVGVAAAVCLCSRNCAAVLCAAGIDEFVKVTVNEAEAGGGPGAAMVIETARRLGVRPDRCVARRCRGGRAIHRSPRSQPWRSRHSSRSVRGAICHPGEVATIFTGRDTAMSEPASTAKQYLDGVGRCADLHQQHTRAWARLWEQCDVGLTDSTAALRVLRLHLGHLLQTISPHTAELDAGVPARGLRGEAYRGHVFWDALFVSPVLNLRMPNVSRSLLLYRYRRRPEARRAAHRAGHLGAMFPGTQAVTGVK